MNPPDNGGQPEASTALLATADFELHLLHGSSAPRVMRALGAARAETFGAAGQGTGEAIDLRPEDDYYHHLILWHPTTASIAGAYRLGVVEDILQASGPGGLYLNQVFEIQPAFYQALGPALELSRSFVVPRYQRDNRALALLWRGLGLAVEHFDIATLYGSVSMAAEFREQSRRLTVGFLDHLFRDRDDLRGLIRSPRPFAPCPPGEIPGSLRELDQKVARLEGHQRRLPPLIRYYCQLGARFLAFHTEATFGDALYCLLRVEVAKIPPAYQRRFLAN